MGPVLPLEQRKLRPRRPSHRAKGRVLRGGGVRTGVSAAKCSSTMATFSQKHHVASCGPLPGVAVVRRLGSPQREAQAGRRAQSGAHGSSLLGRRHYRCPKYSHPARCSDPDTPHAASSSAARSPPPPHWSVQQIPISSQVSDQTPPLGGFLGYRDPAAGRTLTQTAGMRSVAARGNGRGSASWHHPCSGLVGPGHAHVKKQGLAEST